MSMTRPADLVLTGGAVFRSDSARSIASAVAVADGRIVAVGGDGEVGVLIGPSTEVVDLAGRLVCPGFQDAHVHPHHGGRTMLTCDLSDAAGPAEAEARIVRYAAEHPEEPWVTGGGWQFPWYPGGMPSADLLDRLVPDRPAYLRVADGHAGWANHAALNLAGIAAGTADPADGRIERLPDGTPQGTLQEGAMDIVERVVPPESSADRERALLEGQRHLLSLGITAWQDAIVTQELHDSYLKTAGDGRLIASVRGALWWSPESGMEQLDRFEEMRAESGGRYRAGSVKLMLDGVCENFTARMLEPYLGGDGRPTGNAGIDFIDPDNLGEIVTEVMRRGFQPHFHALGDAAVRNALNAVEQGRRTLGWSDVRPLIAHLQVVHPDDVPRFRRLGVVVDAQPLWACNEAAMTELTIPFLGEERSRHQYPFGDLLRAGATLAMGSDWSVSTPDVMQQAYVAVTRSVIGDADAPAFLPDQAITIADALVGFTAGSAYANHLDPDRGTIGVGVMADLVVLGGNPFEEDEFWRIGVDLTIVGGEIVHRTA